MKFLYTLRGILVVTLLLFWLMFLSVFVLITVGIVALLPRKKWREQGQLFLLKYPMWWMDGNNLIMQISTRGKWDIQGSGTLDLKSWYLLIANHRSWVDILVISAAFHRRLPPLKFFMKKELMWMLPIAGFGVYFLGYPLLVRHTRQDIQKNPELKNQDIETTKKACEKFKIAPTSVINFVEGTRFTEQKKERQQSPYQNLLKPKATGIAIVLYELRDYLKGIINITVHYVPQDLTLWNFCCGKLDKIKVRYEVLPVTENLIGDYYQDRHFRVNLQRWLNDQWQAKDKLLDEIQHEQKAD